MLVVVRFPRDVCVRDAPPAPSQSVSSGASEKAFSTFYNLDKNRFKDQLQICLLHVELAMREAWNIM